jgi:hypothetical protein
MPPKPPRCPKHGKPMAYRGRWRRRYPDSGAVEAHTLFACPVEGCRRTEQIEDKALEPAEADTVLAEA